MWPNEDLKDEDELAEALNDAYSAEEWDAGAVLRLLDRGDRRQKSPARSDTEGPEFLRVFIATCKPDVGIDLELSDGARCGADDSFFEVASLGNGDLVACDADGQVFYLDHEADMEADGDGTGLPTMLAAWLFHDEFVRRGLEAHPSVEDHAREAFPEDIHYVFSRIP